MSTFNVEYLRLLGAEERVGVIKSILGTLSQRAKCLKGEIGESGADLTAIRKELTEISTLKNNLVTMKAVAEDQSRTLRRIREEDERNVEEEKGKLTRMAERLLL